MQLYDRFLGRSPWLVGFAVGGVVGLLSFATREGPLPLKLLLAVSSGSFAALRNARRSAGKRLNLQQRIAREQRYAAEPAAELPVGRDFRAEMGRRVATAERARLETRRVEPATAIAPRSEIDDRCDALERSLGSAVRKF